MNYSDKQLKIINTAENLFADKGFDGTSVRDIADMAGVNVAMISYYFGSKEKLMEAIFQKRSETFSARIETILNDESLTPFSKMEIVIDDYVDRIVEKHKFFRLMLCEQVLGKNHIITDLLKQLKKKNAELIGKLIKDGQQKNVFKKDVDIVLLMNTLTGVSIQTFINAEFYREYYNVEENKSDFHQSLKIKLANYIKDLFKAILIK